MFSLRSISKIGRTTVRTVRNGNKNKLLRPLIVSMRDCNSRSGGHGTSEIKKNRPTIDSNHDATGESAVDEEYLRIDYDLMYSVIEPHVYYATFAPDENNPRHKETRRHIDSILAEYEMLKYSTAKVPSTLELEEMEKLIRILKGEEADSVAAYLQFLYKREIERLRAKRNRMKRAKNRIDPKVREVNAWLEENEASERSIFDKEGQPIYRLWRNCMFTKISRQSMLKMGSTSRLRRSALFGQPLIFDFSWQHIMGNADLRTTAEQTQMCYYYNRNTKDPFDIWFVNLGQPSPIEPFLKTHLRILNSRRDHHINISPKHYLDLFPKERLVYLSPHATRPLKTLHPDDIYIIGALSDRQGQGPVTRTRALQEGIAVARLPLDEYLCWGAGDKGLCLNQVVEIMHRVKMGETWQAALEQCVPRRKQKSEQDKLLLEEQRLKKLKRNLKPKLQISVSSLLMDRS